MKNKNLFLTLCLMAMTVFSFAQVQKIDNLHVTTSAGIGTATPVTSAALDITSTTQGFLPPRMNKVQMYAITDVEGLMLYCTDCVPKGIYVNDGFNFLNRNGVPSNFLAGDVYSPGTGQVWMDKNLGATQVATSSTDVDSYGDLYQWGRNTDGHEIRTSTATLGPVPAGAEGSDFITNSTTPNDWLTTQDDTRWNGATKGAEDPCPTGYRVPTETELNNERLTFSSNNAAGAFASALKLPVGGYRYLTNGVLDQVGSSGRYWSSTVNGTNASYMLFNSVDALTNIDYRSNAFSVRCIKE